MGKQNLSRHDQQRPSYIKDRDRLVVVAHTSFMPSEYLPTYNSNVIELHSGVFRG